MAPSDQLAPPQLTKTWFHLGPVGPETGSWSELDYRGEYWPEDSPWFPPPAPPPGLPTVNGSARRVWRDAVRALRGSVLRSEVYTLDGPARKQRPNSVTEHAYTLQEIDAPPPGTWPRRQRVFAPLLAAQRTTRWERGDDPLTKVAFSDEYDDVGQPCRQTDVALPRRRARRLAVDGQVLDETRVLATSTHTHYARSSVEGVYLRNRVCETLRYELAQPPEVAERDPEDLAAVPPDQHAAAQAIRERFGAGQELRCTGHSLHYYDGEAFVGEPLGTLGRFGALTRTKTLAFTEAEIEAAYGDRRPDYLGGPSPLPPKAPLMTAERLGYQPRPDPQQRPAAIRP